GAGAARARSAMARMRGHMSCDRLVALRAQRVVGRRELWIAIDVGLVRIAVARRAGRLAAPEAGALPQADRVVREAARAAVGPIRQLAIGAGIVFEPRLEEIVVVAARCVVGVDDFAQRVALRA